MRPNDKTPPSEPVWDVAALWQRQSAALDRIDRERQVRLVPARRIRTGQWYTMALGVAALVALVIGLTAHFTASRPATFALVPREVATARGQRAHVVLSDGTAVDLSTDSHLIVPTTRGGDRDVYLTGEAVFDVMHDPRHPFRVHTGRAVTEDVGTRFDVRAYPNDAQVRVAVAAGSVAVRGAASANDARLVAGDLALVSGSRVTVARQVDAARYLLWTSGRLMFDHVSVAQVATDLSRWFDVTVQLRDSALATRQLTATLAVESLPDVMDAVTIPLGLRYERHGQTIVLEAKP